MPTQLQALEAFAADADLLHLESLLKRFNLFEAVGAVRHELRHSDFLAFLLDPSRNHGLGAAFLHRFLQAALDLDGIDLSRAYVLREWHHVDILIVDDASHLAVIIENKIDTGEHSDQLNRYRETFQSHFPGYQALGLYLTPDGDESSSPEEYQAVSYMLVCKIIEKVAQDNQATLDAKVVMALKHYAQMLRRHIVSDSDVAELCRSIYKQHKQALDLIFEHGSPPPTQIRDYLVSLIQQQDRLVLYSYGRQWVNFSLREWDEALSGRGLTLRTITSPYLSFFSISDNLAVGIWLSPGKSFDRNRILQLAKDNHLTGMVKVVGRGDWVKLTSFKMLNPRDYDRPPEEIEAIISEKWSSFLQDELPRITEAFQKADWLWELP